eukprot:1197138-Rhodomonas_salina.3
MRGVVAPGATSEHSKEQRGGSSFSRRAELSARVVARESEGVGVADKAAHIGGGGREEEEGDSLRVCACPVSSWRVSTFSRISIH